MPHMVVEGHKCPFLKILYDILQSKAAVLFFNHVLVCYSSMHFVRHDNSINSIIPSDKPKFDSVYIAGMQSIAFKFYTFHRTGKTKLNVDHFNTNIL